MKKNRILFYALLLPWFFVQPTKADYTLDDSCTQGVSILNRIVDDITTLGLFEAYSDSFHMYGADGYGGDNDDGNNGCLADYYPDGCSYSQDSATGEGSSKCSGNAYLHNSSYCQPDGTNCCPSALNDEGLPINSSVIGVPGDCSNDCNPDGGLEFCYDNYDISTLSYTCNGNSTPIWAQDGDSAWYFYPPGQLRVAKDGDKICVQFNTSIGYQNIGCKYLPSCSQFTLDQNCYVAESCYNYAAQHSLAMLPITGAIVQCINDTIQYLFYGNPNCTTSNDSLNDSGGLEYVSTTFPDFQSQMRSTVRSALMLYLVLFGLKTVLGSEHPSKGEFFRMGAKFTLVLYFSTGININGVVDSNGQPYYDDGIHDYMIPLFTTGASELADMVYTAGGSSGLCVYDSSLYPEGYDYLSMWDGIDCRLLYYVGMDLSVLALDSTITLASLGNPILLGLLLPALFSFQIIFLICSIIFVIMLLSVTIYFVNITVISAIVVAILIYIAPVFVPMALFEATKGYYEGWLKTTTAYALQPMIIAAYIAMMFTIFDQTMFGDCVFQNQTVTFEMGGQQKQIPFFMLCDPHDSTGNCYDGANACEPGQTESGSGCYSTAVDTSNENITQCSQTIGYFINPIKSGTSYTNTISAIFFDLTILNNNVASDMMTGVVTLCLFAYVFYKFADVIDEFTGELTGGSLMDSAGKPMALVDKAAQSAKNLMKYAASKKPPDKSGGDTKRKSGATSSSSGDNKKQKSGATSSSAGDNAKQKSGATSSSSNKDK